MSKSILKYLQRMYAAVQFDFILTEKPAQVGKDNQPTMSIFFFLNRFALKEAAEDS